MSRQLFDNNKIVESLCQFTYNPVQDNTVYGQYWEELSKAGVYIQKENLSAFNFNVSGGDQQGLTPSLLNAMKYTDKSKEKIIQLHNNSISIHQLKSYEKWEKFKLDIDLAFNTFEKVTDDTQLERIDLRAINVFEFPLEGFDLKKYFNVFLMHPEEKIAPNINITLEQPLEQKNNFLVIRLKTSFNDNAKVVLDLSYVNIEPLLKSRNYTKISEILEFGHTKMYNLFTSIITEETMKIIK